MSFLVVAGKFRCWATANFPSQDREWKKQPRSCWGRLAWMLSYCLFLFHRIQCCLHQRQGIKAFHDGKHVFGLILRHCVSYLIISLSTQRVQLFPQMGRPKLLPAALSTWREWEWMWMNWIGLIWMQCISHPITCLSGYRLSLNWFPFFFFFFNFLWVLFQMDKQNYFKWIGKHATWHQVHVCHVRLDSHHLKRCTKSMIAAFNAEQWRILGATNDRLCRQTGQSACKKMKHSLFEVFNGEQVLPWVEKKKCTTGGLQRLDLDLEVILKPVITRSAMRSGNLWLKVTQMKVMQVLLWFFLHPQETKEVWLLPFLRDMRV